MKFNESANVTNGKHEYELNRNAVVMASNVMRIVVVSFLILFFDCGTYDSNCSVEN